MRTEAELRHYLRYLRALQRGAALLGGDPERYAEAITALEWLLGGDTHHHLEAAKLYEEMVERVEKINGTHRPNPFTHPGFAAGVSGAAAHGSLAR